MSDVTVAPAAAPQQQEAPQQSQAPATHEVAINQNPTNAPSPVGSQAVEKPDADRRRDSIKAAFERAQNPQAKGVRQAERPPPKAAEAKPGHNQPPEETPRLDLKKRPDEQPRSERGQFAPRARDDGGQTVQNRQTVQTVQTGQDYPKLPPHAPYANPPARMAEHGRREWANTPESVRGEIHRVQNEFMKAYTFYKDDYEAFKPIKKYHEMARQHGTTLETALTNYVNMEQKLRSDPIAGLDVIVRNLGLKTSDGQPAGLRDVAYTILSQSPEQMRLTQQGNAQQAATHQIGALHQEIQGLKTTLQQMHTQQQFSHVRAQVDQFAENHPRLDELGDLIEQELKLGFNIDQAYRRAELLRPASHAAQTRTPSAQTRTPDRSISGFPDVAPSNGAFRKPQKPSGSAREATANALRRMNGVF